MDNNILGNDFGKITKAWTDEFSAQNDVSVNDWLLDKMRNTMGSIAGIHVEEIHSEILQSIERYEQNRKNVQLAFERGQSKEEWMADHLKESTSELEEQEQVAVMGELHGGLADALGMELKETGQADAREYALSGNQLANSAGEMAVARMMQVLGENVTEKEEENGASGVSEYITEALEKHSNNELKKVASGALVSLVKSGRIPLVPATTPAGILAQVTCFAIDHASVIVQIAKKEISLTEGLRIISQNAVSTIWGIITGKDGRIDRDGLGDVLPFLKKPLEIVNKVSDTVLEFVGGEELKAQVAEIKQKIVPVIRSFADNFISNATSLMRSAVSKVKNLLFG